MSRDVFAAALRALDAGRGVAIASVIGAHGSTPRHLGARMTVADDGEQWGTIGGGRIEQVTVAAAREVAAGSPPRVVRQHLVRDLAMCCGGSMEIVLTPGAPSRDVIAALAAGIAEPRVLVTPIDGEPMTLRPVAAGDPPAHRAGRTESELLERVGGGSALFSASGRRGFAVAKSARGRRVRRRRDGALCRSRCGRAGRRIVDAAEVDMASLDDHVLIVTRDHAVDQQILETLITRDDLAYLGMIGSRGKVGRFRKRLEAKGLLADDAALARWARLRAPIGLDVGAETPDEIAVAIAAELVALRRRGSIGVGDWRPVRSNEDA
jgi:xanthine dehydrogenase accessory factor